MLKMKYPTRIYYTETDKALMWDRWQKGESLNCIARRWTPALLPAISSAAVICYFMLIANQQPGSNAGDRHGAID
jgi:hypothetical protein